MRKKNLAILVVAAVVLGGLAYLKVARRQSAEPVLAKKVFAELPVNDVARMVFCNSQTTVTVAKAEGLWAVADRYNYPAKFDKVATTLRQLADLKAGHGVPARKEELADLQLLSPVEEGEKKDNQVGVLIRLFAANEKMLGSLLIGKEYTPKPRKDQNANPWAGGIAKGRYVRTEQGDTLLVSESLHDLATVQTTDWLDEEFVNVSAWDVTELNVTGGSNRPAIKLTRESESRPLELDAIPGDKQMDGTKVTSLSGALSYLRFADIADPALSDEQTGLGSPIVYEAKAKDGRTYTLRLGNSREDGKRYVRVNVAYTPPPPKKADEAVEEEPEKKEGEAAPSEEEQQKREEEKQKKEQEKRQKEEEEQKQREKTAKETETLNAKLGRWVYLLDSYKAESLLTERKDLLKDKEEPKDEKDEDEDDEDKPRARPKPAAADEARLKPAPTPSGTVQTPPVKMPVVPETPTVLLPEPQEEKLPEGLPPPPTNSPPGDMPPELKAVKDK